MNNFELIGKLSVKNNTQKISDKFQKREFVLEIEDGNYSQHIKFQLTQDRCDLLEPYQLGGQLKVQFNLRGRPYQKGNETIYFTNLEAWRIENVTAEQPQQEEKQNGFGSPVIVPADHNKPNPVGDDLPF